MRTPSTPVKRRLDRTFVTLPGERLGGRACSWENGIMRSLAVVLLLCALPALAADRKADPCATKGTNLAYPKGKKIEIVAYHASSATFEIQSPDFPGEGTSFVTFDGLADGVKAVRTKRGAIAADPASLKGAIFTTDKPIPTLFERETEARAECGPLK